MRRNTGQHRRAGLRGLSQRVALLFGVAALVLQLVAWAGMPMPSMALAADPEICSVHDTGATAPEPADHHGRGCPLCPLVHGLSGPPPGDIVGAPVVYGAAQPLPLSGERVAAGWFLSSLQARAPPVAG